MDSIEELLKQLEEKSLLIKPKRGFFGIGFYKPKFEVNLGTLFRSAYIFGASFVFTIEGNYKRQNSDTLDVTKHLPLWNFQTFEAMEKSLPSNLQIIYVEQFIGAIPLEEYKHPERAIYILGNEDRGFSDDMLKGKVVISITSEKSFSLNVSVAGSIIMYDRVTKSLSK